MRGVGAVAVKIDDGKADNGAGAVDATRVRGPWGVGGAVEACVADDELGHLYLAAEDVGIWKYGAEPDAGSGRTLVDWTDKTGDGDAHGRTPT